MKLPKDVALLAAWVVLLIAICVFTLSCGVVPSGYVGVRLYFFPDEGQSDIEVLAPGRYWIRAGERLYRFPTFTQHQTWAASADDDDQDESITFATDQGVSVNADVGIDYAVDPAKVATLFHKYHKGIDDIAAIYLRNMVRDALIVEGGMRRIESVYGSGRAALLAAVEQRVRARAEPFGIGVERLYWAGGFRLPSSVTSAIDAKVQASELAQQRANEVATAKAEADKAIEAARGVAESTLLKAKAEARALRIKGDALRANPRLVELSAVEKWNGTMPQFVGNGAMPFVSAPLVK